MLGRGSQEPATVELEWKEQAACRDADTNLFFPDRGYIGWRAIMICKLCPVREECLEYALSIPGTLGIWGGLTEEERRKLRSRRNRGDGGSGRRSGGRGTDWADGTGLSGLSGLASRPDRTGLPLGSDPTNPIDGAFIDDVIGS